MTYVKAQYIDRAHSRVWALRGNGEQVSASPGADAWNDVHAQTGLRVGTFDDPTEPGVRDATDAREAPGEGTR